MFVAGCALALKCELPSAVLEAEVPKAPKDKRLRLNPAYVNAEYEVAFLCAAGQLDTLQPILYKRGSNDLPANTRRVDWPFRINAEGEHIHPFITA